MPSSTRATTSLIAAAILAFSAPGCASSSCASVSGVDGCTLINEMSGDQKEEHCEWYEEVVQSTYPGRETFCEDRYTVRFYSSVLTCTEQIGSWEGYESCPRTMFNYERCVEAILENPCAAMDDPLCTECVSPVMEMVEM